MNDPREERDTDPAPPPDWLDADTAVETPEAISRPGHPKPRSGEYALDLPPEPPGLKS